jgi:hypothetical protein
VVLENLEVRGAKDGNSYTSDEGADKKYGTANGIYVGTADHVTIRNCVLHDNSEGYFFSSNDKYGYTGDMVIENCYVYNNGEVGSDLVHWSYCESLGITYQYNH